MPGSQLTVDGHRLDGRALKAANIQMFDRAVPREIISGLRTLAISRSWARLGSGTPDGQGLALAEVAEDFGQSSDRSLAPLRLFEEWLKVHLVAPEAEIVSARFLLVESGPGKPARVATPDGAVSLDLTINRRWRDDWGSAVRVSHNGRVVATVPTAMGRLSSFPAQTVALIDRPNETADEGRLSLIVKLENALPREAPVDDPDQSRILGLLESAHAGQTGHSGRSLISHLVGVYRLLKLRGFDRDVALAGLFHSVYGTNIFKKRTVADRDSVRAAIGDRAERLAYLFSVLERPECWRTQGANWPCKDGSTVSVDNADRADLVSIERANLDEQGIFGADRAPEPDI